VHFTTLNITSSNQCLKTQGTAAMKNCVQQAAVKEDVDGYKLRSLEFVMLANIVSRLTELPGGHVTTYSWLSCMVLRKSKSPAIHLSTAVRRIYWCVQH
jgi:hypothetical protein